MVMIHRGAVLIDVHSLNKGIEVSDYERKIWVCTVGHAECIWSTRQTQRIDY